MASSVFENNFQKKFFQTLVFLFCLIVHNCGSIVADKLPSVEQKPIPTGDANIGFTIGTSTLSTTTPCVHFYTIYCDPPAVEDSFYLMFVVGVGITIVFCLCAGLFTCMLYFFCKKPLTPNREGIVHKIDGNIEASKPPPTFEEALKCSKVEYTIDIDETPPPLYASLNV